jgi:hypothetical protein
MKQIKKQHDNSGYRLTFTWSAGHVRITGNKDVDKEAKKAVEGESSNKSALPPYLRKPLGHSLSTIKQKQNDNLKLKWVAMWTISPRYC